MLTAATKCVIVSFESGTRSGSRVASCAEVQIVDLHINTEGEVR